MAWYNGFRPDMTLLGSTPDKIDYGRFPQWRYPRLEPRPRWPEQSSCVRPSVPICGKRGGVIELQVDYHGRRTYLPIVTLRRAA